jgi:hypothetical protein
MMPTWAQAIGYFIGFLFIVLAFGLVVPPTEDHWAFLADFIITFSSTFAFLLLLFYVNNVTGQVTRLARKLQGKTTWPEESLRKFGLLQKAGAAAGIHFGDWLDIQFIAHCTREVGYMIFYPCMVLALLVFARSRIFDAWDIPAGLVIVTIAALGIAVFSALRLRWAAEDMRIQALEHLNRYLLVSKATEQKPSGSDANPPDWEAVTSQLEFIIEQVKNLDVGAFSPYTRQPFVRGLLALIGSVSVFQLIEYFQFG